MKAKVTIKIGGDKEYIIAMRKASREQEIEQHGKLISTRPSKTHKSKKVYDRKKMKISDF